MTYQHALVNYLETYRKKHRLTIDAFIEDVTSQRSYYRYIELTQDLPMDVLLAFTSKYDFDLKELLDFLSDTPDVEFYLAKIRRFKRLKRHQYIDSYVHTIKDYVTEDQEYFLQSMLRDEDPLTCFQQYFKTDLIDELIQRYESGKHQPLILEYMIDLGATYLLENELVLLKKVTDFLDTIRKQSSDRYLDYPATLFLAHIHKENKQLMINFMLSHISLHLFFNDQESFKSYIEKMNLQFQLDFPSFFIEIIVKNFT